MSAPARTRSLMLRVWRQVDANSRGRFEVYDLHDLDEGLSFLEALDVLNERLAAKGEEPVAFDSDCREGICGTCGFLIDGRPHGPVPHATVCQVQVRDLPDGATLTLEPFRSPATPVVRDLVVDRSSLDRLVERGGFISVTPGSAPAASAILVAKHDAERALSAAICIGCAACVAACPNASAALFAAAKSVHLGSLPQGRPQRSSRALGLAEAMDAEGFGHCSNAGACARACPQGIGLDVIARFNRDVLGSRRRA